MWREEEKGLNLNSGIFIAVVWKWYFFTLLLFFSLQLIWNQLHFKIISHFNYKSIFEEGFSTQ